MRSARRARRQTLQIQPILSGLASLLEFFRPDGCVISGGEPLLVENLAELIEGIAKQHIPVSVCTNATLLTDCLARILCDAGTSKMTVGIEGVGEMYDWYRRASGGYRLAVAGIANAASAGIAVTVNVTVHDRLLKLAPELSEELMGMRIKAVTVTAPIMGGRMADNGVLVSALSEDAVCGFAQELRELLDIPVAVRLPRCNSIHCPSGRDVLTLDVNGLLNHCPDRGVMNSCDLEMHSGV